MADRQEQTRDENRQQPEIKIKDRKHVEVAYPSGRRVRYVYNHLLSEMQLPLILPPEEAWEDVCQNIRFRHPDDYTMPSQYQEIDEWDED